ncbi:MAG: hypothetical protein IJ482_05585 [Alphaproteobacteria bacterium]|nr:hypothetical protein [Alphaproteobacteria bacterium]
MNRIFNSEQSGRSMVEMLGVLAIIGVLSVGGISGYSKAMAKFKLTKAQDQLTMLLMNIRTAYATSPSYAGITSSNAIAYNLAPSDMISGTSLHNAFGGSVEVAAGGPSNTHFAIVFNGLGKDTCASLASSDWGSDGLVGIDIAASSVDSPSFTPTHDGSTDAAGKALPVSLTQAYTECGGATATNSITWVYY